MTYDPSKHPHKPAGSSEGGQFAAKPHDLSDLKRSDAFQKMTDLRQGWYKQISPDEHGAVTEYSNLSTNINSFLRAGYKKLFQPDRPYQQQFLHTIRDLITSFRPAPYDMYVYRGSREFPHEIGDTFKDKGFVSTSARWQTAEDWAQPHFARILIKKGTPVAFGNYSEDEDNLDEFEVILPPWSHFKVVPDKGVLDARGRALELSNLGRLLPSRVYHELEYLPTRHDLKTISTLKSLIAKAGNPYHDREGKFSSAALSFDTPYALGAFEKIANDYNRQLTPDQRDAITGYAGTLYRVINNYLRNGDIRKGANTWGMDNTNEEAAQWSQTMLSAMKPLPVDVEVWRGIKRPPEVGAAYTDKGFISTALKKDTADIFTTLGNSTEGYPHILAHFVIPKNTPAIIVGAILGRKEQEIILPPNTQFKVTEHRVLPATRGLYQIRQEAYEMELT